MLRFSQGGRHKKRAHKEDKKGDDKEGNKGGVKEDTAERRKAEALVAKKRAAAREEQQRALQEVAHNEAEEQKRLDGEPTTKRRTEADANRAALVAGADARPLLARHNWDSNDAANIRTLAVAVTLSFAGLRREPQITESS